MFDPIHGGNISSLEEQATESLMSLRTSFGLVMARIEALNVAIAQVAAPKNYMELVKPAITQLNRIEELSVDAFKALTEAANEATTEPRRFQVEHGIAKAATTPNPLDALLVIVPTGLGEGIFTGVLMIGDGKMDVVTGMTYGLTVAFVNIVAGLVGGFLGLRYSFYKQHAPQQTLETKLVRQVARCGLGAVLFAFVLLHFSAARVRATGTHGGIFDFTEVGLLDTFNDYFAIAIVVVGVIGSVLALYKGYSGLSDPVPGYSKAQSDSENAPAEAAEDLQDICWEQLEDIHERVTERIEKAQTAIPARLPDFNAQHQQAQKAIVDHNNLVHHEKDRLRAEFARKQAEFEWVSQIPWGKSALNLDAFNALLIDALPPLSDKLSSGTPSNGSPDDALDAFISRYDEAVLAVQLAYAAFITRTPKFTFTANKE